MYIVGITGASGPVIGVRLIEELINSGREVTSVVSESAWKIMGFEMGVSASQGSGMKELLRLRGIARNTDGLREYDNKDLFAPISSGSFRFDAVIVAPCSMKSLAAIASGYADSLIGRTVDVALKESRRCVLIPRETPLSLIHLENMQKAKTAGADILIPVPGFYTQPKTIEDVVDFVVGKTLNLLEIEHRLFTAWGAPS